MKSDWEKIAESWRRGSAGERIVMLVVIAVLIGVVVALVVETL